MYVSYIQNTKDKNDTDMASGKGCYLLWIYSNKLKNNKIMPTDKGLLRLVWSECFWTINLSTCELYK